MSSPSAPSPRRHGTPEGTTAFTYVPLGGVYARSDLTLVELASRLWRHHDGILGDEGKKLDGRRGVARRVPRRALKAVHVGRRLAQFLRSRWQSSPRRDVLRLPVRGHLAIVRRSGAVKVFDLDAKRVDTVMTDATAAAKLAERVASARSVEGHPFAPDVLHVDLARGTFAESLLEGTRPRNFRGCFEGFEVYYLELLVAFLRAEAPRTEELSAYVASLREDVLDPSGVASRLPEADRARVRRRVEASVAALEGVGGSLPRALSHGDFFSGNIVVNGDRAAAIDWAHVGRRSPAHDLLYLAMNHCVRVFDPPGLAARAGEMMELVRARLQRDDPARFAELEPWLSVAAPARHLFYLECIQVPLVHCDRADDRYVAAMLQRVAWFDAFEGQVAGAARDVGS